MKVSTKAKIAAEFWRLTPEEWEALTVIAAEGWHFDRASRRELFDRGLACGGPQGVPQYVSTQFGDQVLEFGGSR